MFLVTYKLPKPRTSRTVDADSRERAMIREARKEDRRQLRQLVRDYKRTAATL